MATDYRLELGRPEMEPSNRDADCYVLTVQVPDQFNLLGSRSVYCFDVETDALVTRVTNRGERVETFVTHLIKRDVTEDDLAPL